MNIKQEIHKYAAEANKVILLWLFERYHWASQWRFVAQCEHRRYGSRSYETHRIWSPTIEGRALFAQLSPSMNKQEV